MADSVIPLVPPCVILAFLRSESDGMTKSNWIVGLVMPATVVTAIPLITPLPPVNVLTVLDSVRVGWAPI